MSGAAVTEAQVLVVGGGIGGLAVAAALARGGKRVRVLEKASEFGEIGAGIQIAPNGSRALDRLGVLAEIHASAVFPRTIAWLDAVSGEPLTSLALGDAFRARYGYPYFVMHRSDLLAALLAACRADERIALETERDVTALEDHGSFVQAACADGTAYRCEVLVGADGLRSVVRQHVVGDGEPVCSEYVAYRGTLPVAQLRHDADLDGVLLWTGPGMHLVQYPVRRGELYNQVAVFKSDRYAPGARDWGSPEELDARFGRGCPAVRAAAQLIARDRRWPMYDRLPVERWTRNRVVLIGDAAHPMLQYLAQGACQALEDAVAFAGALAAHDDVLAGLAAYAAARAPRTARVQTTARAWGDLWHLDPGEELARRDALLRRRAPDDYGETDWLYGDAALAPAGAQR
jgi:salicylate hydroxylase